VPTFLLVAGLPSRIHVETGRALKPAAADPAGYLGMSLLANACATPAS
jgi:hypothetical protein